MSGPNTPRRWWIEWAPLGWDGLARKMHTRARYTLSEICDFVLSSRVMPGTKPHITISEPTP